MERLKLIRPIPNKVGKTMTQKQLEHRLDVSAMTVYLWRMKKEDPFPCRTVPTSGGKHKIFFPIHEVYNWLARNRPEKAKLLCHQIGGLDGLRGTFSESAEVAAA